MNDTSIDVWIALVLGWVFSLICIGLAVHKMME